MAIEVRPITPALGAEIFGADLGKQADIADVKQAFADYGVVAVRDANLSPDGHIAFAKQWGEINVNRFFRPVESHPQIAEVRKEPDQKSAIGERWHTDHSYDQIPAVCSILHAIETPEIGGDTAFAGMHAALMGLSEGMRATLSTMKAWHSSRHAFGARTQGEESVKTGRIGNADAATQDALHPVVIKHPLSGKPCLYVNGDFTTHFDGWSKEDSAPLLSYLYEHATKPEYTCRLRWQKGTVGMWDNRATLHRAINDYHGHRRLMHRITVEGVELKAAS